MFLCLSVLLSGADSWAALSRTVPPKAGSPYRGGQLHTVVEIPKPEEVGEPVSDVKWTQLLVAQGQEPQDVHIVLISPNAGKQGPSGTSSMGHFPHSAMTGGQGWQVGNGDLHSSSVLVGT